MTAHGPGARLSGLVTDSAWGVGAQVVGGVASLGLVVALARWLPLAAHGQVQATIALLGALTLLGQLGVPASAIHRLTVARRPAPVVLGTAFASIALSGIAVCGLLAVLHPLIASHLLMGLPWGAYAVALLALGPILVTTVAGGVARGLGRFDIGALAQAGPSVLALAGIAIAGLTGAAHPSRAIGVVALAHLTVAVAVVVLVVRRLDRAPTVDGSELGAMSRFGARTYVHNLGSQLHERIDLFLLAGLLQDPVVVGTYAVSLGIASRLWIVPRAVSAAVYPRLGGASRGGGAVLVRDAAWTATGSGLGIGLGVALVAPLGVPALFGSPFVASVGPLLVLLPATVAYGHAMVLARWFQARDQQGVLIGIQGLGIALNVGLNLAWIPEYGALGAAVASAASYGVQGLALGLVFAGRST